MAARVKKARGDTSGARKIARQLSAGEKQQQRIERRRAKRGQAGDRRNGQHELKEILR